MDCTDAQKVRLAVFQWTPKTQIWWKSKERELAPPGEVITWDMFMEEIRNKYISIMVMDRKASKFSSLVQGSMTITEFDTKFEEL